MKPKYFLSEFAIKLLEYKNNRKLLLKKLDIALKNANTKIPSMNGDTPKDITPFSVLMIITQKTNNYEHTQNIWSEIKKEFKLKSNIDNNNIAIPMLPVRKYIGSDYKYINLGWDLFEVALYYSYSQNNILKEKFIKLFDRFLKTNDVSWNVTCAFYWSNPDFYISLDKYNRKYLIFTGLLYDFNKKLKSVTNHFTGEEYLSLNDKVQSVVVSNNYPFKSIPDLTGISYDYDYEIDNSFETVVTVQKGILSEEKFLKKYELLKEQGIAGENFVLEYEKNRIKDISLIEKIKNISKINVSAGYDIESFNSNKSIEFDRFIEVKTFIGNSHFYWTKNEIEKARIYGKNYYIYLVNYEKINNKDYEPEIIKNPYNNIYKKLCKNVYENDNEEFSVIPTVFLVNKK